MSARDTREEKNNGRVPESWSLSNQLNVWEASTIKSQTPGGEVAAELEKDCKGMIARG